MPCTGQHVCFLHCHPNGVAKRLGSSDSTNCSDYILFWKCSTLNHLSFLSVKCFTWPWQTFLRHHQFILLCVPSSILSKSTSFLNSCLVVHQFFVWLQHCSASRDKHFSQFWQRSQQDTDSCAWCILTLKIAAETSLGFVQYLIDCLLFSFRMNLV